MRVLVFMLIFTSSTATFHKFKPHKLYKHLVAPLFDLTGSLLDPVGHILNGGKRRKKHHNKHHHNTHSDYYEEPEFIHEHEVYINHGGPLIYPGHAACGSSDLEYHQGYEGIPHGYPIPYLGDLHHEDDSYEEGVEHF